MDTLGGKGRWGCVGCVRDLGCWEIAEDRSWVGCVRDRRGCVWRFGLAGMEVGALEKVVGVEGKRPWFKLRDEEGLGTSRCGGRSKSGCGFGWKWVEPLGAWREEKCEGVRECVLVLFVYVLQ